MVKPRDQMIVMIGLVLLLCVVTPVRAQDYCTFSTEVGILQMDVSGWPGTTLSAIDGNIDIRYQGSDESVICADISTGETPTVTNTDKVLVSGGSPRVDFIINLTGGPFAPGRTAEPDGSSEIEFEMELSVSPDENRKQLDLLIILGTEGADRISSSSNQAVNLNASEAIPDIDVTAYEFDILGVEGRGGSDRISGSAGFLGEGLFGGAGRDTLQGGAGFDLLIGQADNDRLNGGGGPDILVGGPGRDRCVGGPGKEQLKSCD